MTITHSTSLAIEDEPPNRPRLTFRKITEQWYDIPGHGRVLCRLWRMVASPADNHPVVYAVEMRGLGSRRMYTVGTEERSACRIHAMLVRNTVTPCGLRDVLDELI